MTAKEMAHWERWHGRGRRTYQIHHAARAFGGAMLTVLLQNALGFGSPPPIWIILGAITSTPLAVWFFAGHHWDARIEEYKFLTARPGQI
ncbi:hypothetical protein Verru16b_03565 [Lacunisphaera limnophila]|uniref:Uncharacterized protein n=1 Tax=Lacunisphaera limnophila TaxID=1838286 RepID=A0A1D8AZY9_9BACT|nr:hypothetical protein [Lacunisphaera limnophila]AOS46459.1 hypothetical protein Verru16b_03565 [Lacunisphaera limnophila]